MFKIEFFRFLFKLNFSVVTGIQWVIKNKVLSLEIREGLYKNGSIDLNKNLSWHRSPIVRQTELLNVDFRSFWLEDFTTPTNSLVAGLKFKFFLQSTQLYYPNKFFLHSFNFFFRCSIYCQR